ncbi:MAG: protein kinase domain-containing protein, partial [Candidatus Rokuibacteriota bacterium]
MSATEEPAELIVPGYSVEEELGGSPDHRLHRGRRQSDGAFVLLKTSPHGGLDAEARLKRELEIGHELGIVGLVPAQDLVLTSMGSALVLADPGGEPLDRLLARGPLDLVVALECGQQLAETLARLHDRGFIHRDIQPGHVFVDPATRRAVLGGLGFASSVPREAPGIRAWDPREATLAYLAPEQTGRIDYLVDYRADLYSLGV